jgi:phosphoglycolate phosphatase
MKKPHLVFDFDGTLADSRSVFISSYNILACRYRFHLINEKNIDALKKLTMLERFRQLKVPLFWLPLLTRKFLRIYHQRVNEIPFMPGMKDVLKLLAEEGYDVSILSSNSKKTIAAFLDAHSVNSISGIYSSGRLFRKDKLLKRFIRQRKIEKEHLIYICDELRDVEACRKAGIPVIWVSWGFEKLGVFGDQVPEHIANSPIELLNSIRNFSNAKRTPDQSMIKE